ncbi:MAG: dihydroorotate dehydrogenase [Solirubrobacterales bacterium]
MTDFCGITLAHPVINGSGTYDALAARRVFGDAFEHDFPFSAYVSKTITREPRAGNPPPRLWELGQGMINSIGLPNKGLDRFVDEDLPQYATLPVPLIVSVMGFNPEELIEILQRLDGRSEIAAIELNFSCPNVKTGNIVGSVPSETESMMAQLRPVSTKPLIAKLSPSTARPDLVAAAAESAGADAVSLINTLPGMAVHPISGEPWLGGTTGGISGPAIRPVALAQTAQVASSVAVPVVAMGGIESGAHAADFLAAGASLVAVGTENFRDPAAGNRVASELEKLSSVSAASR